MILLIGLAVGVDYALFYLRRVREERAAGRSKEAAIEAAAATSGRAVLVSGITVMIAMAGMYFAGAPTFTSFATGTILVVAVAMLGSLTVLPAAAVDARRPHREGPDSRPGRLQRRVARVGIWSRIVDRVLRRPLLSAGLATGLLVALAIPALGMRHRHPDTSASLPQDQPVVQTFNHLQEAFPTETSSLSVVDQGQGRDGPGRQGRASAKFEHAVGAAPGACSREPEATIDVNPDKTVGDRSRSRSPATGPTTSRTGRSTCSGRRGPATLGAVAGVEAYVGGGTAAGCRLQRTR